MWVFAYKNVRCRPIPWNGACGDGGVVTKTELLKFAEIKVPVSFWSFEKDADGRVRKVKITELTVIGCIRVVTSDTKNK